MFDPRDPYERYYWHYESQRPLSLAQIIALRSVDAETVATVWLLLEHGASIIVAGPTDPQPGVGKTTTLNALLQFLPVGTAIAYMSGMYEDFAFTRLKDIEPATTYALSNEVSNHLSIYMWGKVARRYLALPARGFHIATSMHADTLDDVISTFQRDLHLSFHEMRHLGLIVNIGLVGRSYHARRRWFSTHFMQPEVDIAHPNEIQPVPLSLWNSFDDTFEHADEAIQRDLARWSGLTLDEFQDGLTRRVAFLQSLTRHGGVDMDEMDEAIEQFRHTNGDS